MTRAQWRLIRAWETLILSGAIKWHSGHFGRWLERRYGTDRVEDISGAQARGACRQLHAWRHSCRPNRNHHRIAR